MTLSACDVAMVVLVGADLCLSGVHIPSPCCGEELHRSPAGTGTGTSVDITAPEGRGRDQICTLPQFT